MGRIDNDDNACIKGVLCGITICGIIIMIGSIIYAEGYKNGVRDHAVGVVEYGGDPE